MTVHRRLAVFLLLLSIWKVSATGIGETPPDGGVVVSVPAATLKGPSGVAFLPLLGDMPVRSGRTELSVEVLPAPDVMVARLVSGEAAIGVLPTNVAAQLYNRGVPVQIAGVFLWGVLYVVSDEDISGWEDLAGRTVYSLAAGSTPDVLFRLILEKNGIDPVNDLTIDYRFGQVELAQMLVSGRVDTAVLPEPFVTRVTAARPELAVVLDFQSAYSAFEGTSYPQTAIVVRSDYFDGKRDVLDGALASIRHSVEAVSEDPAWAVTLEGLERIGLPPETVVNAFPRLNVRYQTAEESRDDVHRYLSALFGYDPRGVGGSVPDDGFYLP